MVQEKIGLSVWFDACAEQAANFYAETFPQSRVNAVRGAPCDFHSGKTGDVIAVNFTVFGLPFLGLNGGDHYRSGESLAVRIVTDSQQETDRYWNAIVSNRGEEGERGRCRDRFGLRWQLVPRRLAELLNDTDRERASRVFEAMGTMRKLDIAVLEAAADGSDPMSSFGSRRE